MTWIAAKSIAPFCLARVDVLWQILGHHCGHNHLPACVALRHLHTAGSGGLLGVSSIVEDDVFKAFQVAGRPLTDDAPCIFTLPMS
jgi:hypothetical protein